MTYPHNLNDTEPGGLISEAEFDALTRKTWSVKPETKIERMARVPFAVVLGILGAVLVVWGLMQ